MGVYLKDFDTHAEYSAYISGAQAVLPNVSYCEDNNEVHYNPYVPETPSLMVYYDIQDISSPTTIFTNYDNTVVKSLEIDNAEMIDTFSDGNVAYQFNSIGEHVIKYNFNTVDKVGNNSPLFNGLSTPKRAVITNGITTIGNYVFYYCSGLTSVTIPESVTSIGNYSFQNCTGLTNVTLNGGVTIGDNAFYQCSSLTNINIPNTVTSIGSNAFDDTGLTSITIPNSVTTIGHYAFYGCNDLITATIGTGVTSIGNYAFGGDTSLISVTIQATTPPSLGTTGVFGGNASSRKIYVPSASVTSYQGATNWSTYAADIEAIPT